MNTPQAEFLAATMNTNEKRNTVSISSICRTLWITVAVLLAIHVILTVVHYRVSELPWLLRQIFDVDEEDSLPTWYSASALLLTSFVLWINARARRQTGDKLHWYWYGLAGGFLLLSVDEIAGMHETLNSLIEISWAIPGGILAAFVGGIYLHFLFQIDRKTAIQFVIGGALFVGGAVGVELATESFAENDELGNNRLDTLAYYLWTTLEEAMEMAGVLVFLRALLLWMKEQAKPAHVELTLAP